MATTAAGTPYVESSDLVANYPGVSLALANHIDTIGNLLQIVFASTSTPTTSVSSTYANTALTATITPSATSSKVLILVSHAGVNKTGDTYAQLRLTRDGTAITGDWAGNINYTFTTLQVTTQAGTNFLDSPAATTALVYRTQLASGANIAQVTVSNASSLSTMILIEVAG